MGGQSSFDHVQAESESHHQYDRSGSPPRIFLKMSTWSNDDGPPDDRLGFHLECFLKNQHVHGQKMIDCPG